MTTVITKNGKVIKVISREEENKTLSVSDKEKKAAYIEYANGDRKYAE